ncbi:MAG: thiamine-phosphate kinase [Dokdonella sp.]
MSEFDLIELMRTRCALQRADVRLGIGDDAAVVVPPGGHELIVCTDTLVSGIHFPASTSAADIGWKSLAVNLSDLAAMGATPAWALLALTLPNADRDFVEAFCDGFAAMAAQHHVSLIGGDTTRGPLTITVTALGFVPTDKAVRRDGARIGDEVHVTGVLGDAAAGLQVMNGRPYAMDREAPSVAELRRSLLAKLNRPQPQIAAGLALRGVASACIDVSDGLLADLGHVAAASAAAIEIESRHVPTSAALATLYGTNDRIPLQLAGGDDYELAFTVAPSRSAALTADLARIGCGSTRIGRVVAGTGVRALDSDGNDIAPKYQGWEHFS